MIFRNKIHLVAKDFWRLLEVYLFLIVSVFGGQAIVKNTYLLNSKSKDKTAETRFVLSTKTLLTYPKGFSPNEFKSPRNLHHVSGMQVDTNSDDPASYHSQPSSLSQVWNGKTAAPGFAWVFRSSYQNYIVQRTHHIANFPPQLHAPCNLIQINSPLLT